MMRRHGFSREVKKCIKNCMRSGPHPRSDIAQGHKLAACVKNCRKRHG